MLWAGIVFGGVCLCVCPSVIIIIIIIIIIIGRHITQVTDDNREKALLYQRLSVLIQPYNAVAILGTFAHTTPEDEF